ncbi:uncharacterized protein J4E78_003079 [Alternaria triticimaculans]|uniref:uncharacterized protein n=1 Tax=Alternaria triticimaculans TaxID=297637 RepID=UPI0020C49979|nr:uncharacterized protein J4E78_003079 [Alternaria triticimaculans]KAI4665617.1 hypothetical protein J4E78_003079 [Alternaria triticimaculans]
MAATLPSRSSEHHFSISNIISKFRSKKGTSNKKSDAQPSREILQETRLPLKPAPLPLVLPEHQQALSALGWTTVTFPESSPSQSEATNHDHQAPAPVPHPLQAAYEQLFAASQAFFNQPDKEKQRWKHKLKSEEGWSKISGEKEFITLRTLEYCPEVLRGPAKRYWDLIGQHCSNTLGRISTSLGLPDGEDEGLRQFVGPCGALQASDKEKTATMLRLFRYEGWEAKVVAEPHADLGLLSVVVGDVPGLEVWDGANWFEVEKVVEDSRRKGATMLAGRQLERLSNGRYPAGGHRVVAYGSPEPSPNAPSTDDKKYRFSIVFVLRAHEPLIINSDSFETEVTGKWLEPMNGVTAGRFYEKIRGQHFNINIDMDEREKQRNKLNNVKDRKKQDWEGKEGKVASSG